MDENLTALFNIFKDKGFFETEEEFLGLINKEGVGVLYPSMPEGMFETEEEFVAVFAPSLKKKDDSQPVSVSPSENGLLEQPQTFRPLPTGKIISREEDTAIERTLGKNFVTDLCYLTKY